LTGYSDEDWVFWRVSLQPACLVEIELHEDVGNDDVLLFGVVLLQLLEAGAYTRPPSSST
jgi:hypothetical protein